MSTGPPEHNFASGPHFSLYGPGLVKQFFQLPGCGHTQRNMSKKIKPLGPVVRKVDTVVKVLERLKKYRYLTHN